MSGVRESLFGMNLLWKASVVRPRGLRRNESDYDIYTEKTQVGQAGSEREPPTPCGRPRGSENACLLAMRACNNFL
jgi:hypothetical protein